MSPNARTTGFAGVATCLAVGAALVAVAPVVGESPPQRITSDTPEYCLQLRDRVSELERGTSPRPSQEAIFLSSEGQRMCSQGQTKGGILRLRRALMLMMRQGDDR